MSASDEAVDAGPSPRLEQLAEPVHDGTHVSAGVISNGCTSANSFRIDHHVGAGVCLISVVREHEDLCRRMPRIVQVRIPWQLPVDGTDLAVEFLNPGMDTLSSPPGRRRSDR